MAEHSGGKDPISSIGNTVVGGIMGVFTGIFVLGMFLGGITGNAPIKASLFDVWAWGQMAGAWIHAGGNSGVQTFGDEKYFQNSKKVGSDTKPEQRLNSPTREPSNLVLPTSTRTQDFSLSVQNVQESFTYTDTNNDGVIDTGEIKAQNKSRSR